MKILHVETGRNFYGGPLQVYYLIRGLHQKGIENHLICPEAGALSHQSNHHATLHTSRMGGDMDIRFPLFLIKIINKIRPDILHIHCRRGADYWGAVTANITKTTSVITRRVDNPEKPVFSGWKYRRYNRIIAVSNGIASVLQAQGIRRDRITVIPDAVDTDLYDRPCDHDFFLKTYKISPNQRVIGVIAQLIKRKGHRYLIDAMPNILKHHPDTRFIFFGKGPLHERLRQRCRKKNISRYVCFAGFRKDLHRILPCLDLVVHPALMEGMGVSLLQALSAGVPVIGTCVGGIPEVIDHGVNGYLIDPESPDQITDSVITLFENPALAERMGRNGRLAAKKRFSIRQMVHKHQLVYRDIHIVH